MSAIEGDFKYNVQESPARGKSENMCVTLMVLPKYQAA